jgi:peptide/nickel transport system permease protein
MLQFALRRLLVFPFALALINFLGFGYARFARFVQASRNPYLAVGEDPSSLWESYRAYLSSAADGFGFMPTMQGVSIVDMVSQAAVASLGLLGAAFGVAVVLGFLLGYTAARSNPPGVAGWLAPLATIGMAMPSFYVGGLLIAGVVYYALYGPSGRGFLVPISGFGWDAHLVFPLAALALRPLVQIAQVTAVGLSGELGRQYIVAARAQGHPERRIRIRHALRNTLAPLALQAANAFRFTLVELILVETLFSWTGLGWLFAQTLRPPDIATVSRSALASPIFLYAPLVATLLTVFGFLFLAADLAASLAVRAADPRQRIHPEDTHHV